MQEFETFTYLDVPKTGSTFICDMLKTYSSEKEVKRERHCGVDTRHKERFYFISVRNPLDQYISLFSYGCQGYGGMVRRFANRGFDHLYDNSWDAFKYWLEFVLDPENANMLDRDCEQLEPLGCLVGYQSLCVLLLSFAKAKKKLSKRAKSNKEEIRTLFANKNISRFTIRYEHLVADLIELVSGRIPNSISNVEGAVRHIRAGKPSNASDRIDRYYVDIALSGKLRNVLMDREWLLYENFGYA